MRQIKIKQRIKAFSSVMILFVMSSLIIALLSGCSSVSNTMQSPYTLTESWGGKGDVTGKFNEPTGIAVTHNEVFVSDARNARIQVFDYEGNFKRVFGYQGSDIEKLSRPMNLAVSKNELYVTDYFNDRIQVYTLAGQYQRSLGKSGHGPGEFDAPVGIDVADNGDLYVVDFYNQRLQQLRRDGSFVRQWGTTGKTGFLSGQFNYPTDVALDADNNLYVADGFNDRMQVFDKAGEYAYKWGGLWGMNVSGSRPGWFKTVTSTSIGPNGHVYVADFYNDRMQEFSADGDFLDMITVPSENLQHTVIAVAVAQDGTVFLADHGNHRIQKWQKQALNPNDTGFVNADSKK